MHGLDEHRCRHKVEGMRLEERCHCSESSGSDWHHSTTHKAVFPSCQVEEATVRGSFPGCEPSGLSIANVKMEGISVRIRHLCGYNFV